MNTPKGTTLRKRIALLLLPLAFVALTAAKCGEASKDDAPDSITGAVVDAKYGPETPLSNGKKCTYGSFTVVKPNEIYQVCADTAKQYADAKIGDSYTRTGK